MGIKKKLSDSHAAKVWRKNYEEVQAEAKKNKSKGGVSLFLIHVLQLFLQFLTIYFCVIVSVLYLAPLAVSYIGGLMAVSMQSDFMMLVSTWLAPSLLALGFLFVGTVFVIYRVNRFWVRCCKHFAVKVKNCKKKKLTSPA